MVSQTQVSHSAVVSVPLTSGREFFSLRPRTGVTYFHKCQHPSHFLPSLRRASHLLSPVRKLRAGLFAASPSLIDSLKDSLALVKPKKHRQDLGQAQISCSAPGRLPRSKQGYQNLVLISMLKHNVEFDRQRPPCVLPVPAFLEIRHEPRQVLSASLMNGACVHAKLQNVFTSASLRMLPVPSDRSAERSQV